MELHIYLHVVTDHTELDKINSKLDKLISSVTLIEGNEHTMSAELDKLTQDVADNTSVEQSAIQLITNLAGMVAAAQTDPSKLAALSSALNNEKDALAAAITANTPAAPAGPADPGTGGATASGPLGTTGSGS